MIDRLQHYSYSKIDQDQEYQWMEVFCSLSGSRCRRPGEVCREEGVVVCGGGELGAGPGHVVARHDEDDITVPPPQHLH